MGTNRNKEQMRISMTGANGELLTGSDEVKRR